MRTYWCDECEKCVDINMEESSESKCAKVFGYNFKTSDRINMRTTWSGQTQVEFSQTTIDKDIAERNAK